MKNFIIYIYLFLILITLTSCSLLIDFIQDPPLSKAEIELNKLANTYVKSLASNDTKLIEKIQDIIPTLKPKYQEAFTVIKKDVETKKLYIFEEIVHKKVMSKIAELSENKYEILRQDNIYESESFRPALEIILTSDGIRERIDNFYFHTKSGDQIVDTLATVPLNNCKHCEMYLGTARLSRYYFNVKLLYTNTAANIMLGTYQASIHNNSVSMSPRPLLISDAFIDFDDNYFTLKKVPNYIKIDRKNLYIEKIKVYMLTCVKHTADKKDKNYKKLYDEVYKQYEHKLANKSFYELRDMTHSDGSYMILYYFVTSNDEEYSSYFGKVKRLEEIISK